MSPDVRLCQNLDGLHHRTTATCTVLFRQDWEAPVMLDGAAHAVWTCLSIGGTVDEFVADIAEVYGIDETDVRSGVTQSLVELERFGVVRRLPDKGGCDASR